VGSPGEGEAPPEPGLPASHSPVPLNLSFSDHDRSVCLLALNQSTSGKIKSFNKGAINSPSYSPRSLCLAPIASLKLF
jgi:hypothetical protein